MARKSAPNGSVPSPSSPELSTRPLGPLSVLADKEKLKQREEDVTKINNMNPSDLKNACDDALKRFLSHPELFRPNHIHTDVRLALGWTSVFVAFGTGLYGWKIDFEKSKPVVWAGVILYVVLSVVQTLYAYFIERDIVFLGKRKTFDKRIVTERITITSQTAPHSLKPSSGKPSPCPSYNFTISYLRSASSGKSLLAKGKTSKTRQYNELFDEDGLLDISIFETWVGQAVEDVMDGEAK
jgi:signal peptidase complex subunit 2